MTNSQKQQIRASEIRQRLNEIAGLAGDDFTDEVREEADRLTTEFRGVETKLRASLIAEGAEEGAKRGAFGTGDGEPAEVRSLLGRVSLTDYLGPASAGTGIVGAAAELNAALKVETVGKSGGVAVPWAALEPATPLAVEGRDAAGLPVETRAFTTTDNNDGPEMQRPILQRLFGPGIMDAMGVRMDSVPAGRTEWPLVNTGVAPGQVEEGTAAAAAVAMTFTYATLKPKRLTGRYEYTHEAAASVAGLEQAMRRDIADAVKASMNDAIINGAEATATDPQNVQGFLSRLTAADLSAAEAAAADYGRMHSIGVDGIHAGRETEVTSIIGEETYRHSAGVYIAGSGEAGSELLSRRSGGCMATTYIPDKDATSMLQSAVLHSTGPNGGGVMRGDSVAAMWPTLEIIRDIYSQASQGVTLTWVGLWDARTAFRAAAYKHIAVNIG